MSLIVRPDANAEVTEALAWLVRKRRYRVVSNLWAMWNAGLDAISAAPRQYPPADDGPPGLDVRNYLLPRYDYRIVYQLVGNDVVILAFAHGRRRDAYWDDRVATDDSPSEGSA